MKLISKLSFVLLLFCGSEIDAQTLRTDSLPSWAFGGFVRPKDLNPIISPNENSRFPDPIQNKLVDWESNDTFNPGATKKGKEVVLLYRAEDKFGIGIGFRTSRLGYASSRDGLHFKRRKHPVLFPSNDDQKQFEWPGGCEDPRVAVTEDGTYVVFYTQWNRDLPRLGVATSKNLKKWTKHGPIFQDAYDNKFFHIANKSASILTQIKNGKQVIAKVNGKYWLYWGELHVFAATSENLVDWQPLVDKNQKLVELISPRKGYFDSELTECGPPALLTDKGILLFYNGKNKAGADGDPRFNANTYCAGQVLFDKNDPTKAIARLDVPFLRPMEPFEKSGQYINGTVFIQGMAYLKNKWFLYYGCADSRVAVAVYDPANRSLPDPIPVK
ncbi:glycoside hydrolase family 130 protein [Hufsiella arboris]|nr:glycoside hydrolase family 130 protein [Hufsiella arboris]